jgi:non-ribosomal peptide synthetase component E (peptide arylation enzyme)
MFKDLLSYAHKLALADADFGKKLSFTEFKDKVSMVGSRFSQLGIEKRDLVLLFFPILFIPRSVSFGLFQLGWWKPL